MSKKWKEIQVSTPEQIFSRIKEDLAHPVGIIIFGADEDFTNEVMNEVMSGLGGFAHYYTKQLKQAVLEKAFTKYPAVVVMLSKKESKDRFTRLTLVERMRHHGAKTVIGIHAKACKISRWMVTYGSEEAELNARITAIKNSNPAEDGYDCLVEVPAEKEG